jgi:DNA-binding FadR family transcriptional regulator
MKNPVKFDAVRVNSIPEFLVDQIMKQIKSGKRKPGEVLPSQRELERMFGVCLGSIREAIKIIGVMGYLNIIRGKGTIVSKDALSIQKQIPTIK